MIFSKFFKSNWQHKDPSVRILAVNDELSFENNEQEKILNDLLNQDTSELVRRAVLMKRARFDVFLAASQENSLDKVRNFAQKQVQAIVLGEHDIKLTLEQQREFLKQANDKPFLENWLAHADAEQTELVIALLEKLAKPQLFNTVFVQKQHASIQQYIIDRTDDVSTLERFAKKTKLEPIKTVLESKLAAIIEAAEKPVKLAKSTQLLLSKLLSLKDATDYEVMLNKKEQLLADWQKAQTDFDCLSEQQRDEFLEKFSVITTQIDKAFVQKAEAYQQDLIAKEIAQAKMAATQTFNDVIAELSQQLATAIFNNEEVDEHQYQQTINNLSEDINLSVLDEHNKKVFLQTLSEQNKKLTQLPVIAESVTQATHLISKMSQLSVPKNLEELKEKLPGYDEWKKDWRTVEQQAAGFLPASIVDAHKELVNNWQSALKPLFSEQRKLFSQTQKKMNDVKRLIASGKYNAAFGVFKRFESYFAKLDEKQQHQLQREHDSLTEKISELSDWEHYIATPRKQQLLNEIEQLVTSPLDNPNAQAVKVKAYRKTWNSLGHADDDVDNELNKAFNQACEQAFAPCRLYYAEQEKLREQHLASRNKVISQANSFVSEFLANQASLDVAQWKEIDAKLNKLQQQWKDAGEIDRQLYKTLQHDFTETMKPLKIAIVKYHSDNAQQKRSLIAQVDALVGMEDVYAAIDKVKGLQAQWKSIGYCGPKDENKLWQSFRKVNDAIFSKRDQHQASEKNAQNQLLEDYQQQLNQLKAEFDDVNDVAGQSQVLNLAEQLLTTVLQHKPILKSVVKGIESFIVQVNAELELAKQAKTQKQWQQLFSVLESMAKDNELVLEELFEFRELPLSWQKKVSAVIHANKADERGDKTLELEILAGIDSPKEFVNQRLAVQVNLMQNQMLTGGKVDLPELLSDWLRIGRFDNEDLAFIERVKPIFCQ